MPSQRDHTIDRIRALFLLLMLIDHTLHGYADYWGRFWFVQDNDRDSLWDAVYLHNNSVIIPMLFFMSGQTVFGSLKQHELGHYIGRRFLQLMVPAILGVVFLVPFMSYGKFVLQQESNNLNFWAFCWESFFAGKTLQAGPMWVLYIIFLHSTCAALMLACMKNSGINWVSQSLQKTVAHHPIKLLLIVIMICAFILGFSNIRWGAPWWIGWGKLFHVQGSRFMIQGLFFWIGVFWGLVPQERRESLYSEGLQYLKPLAGGLIFIGFLYIYYALSWHNEGAYSDEVYHHFLKGGTWANATHLLVEHSPGILIRTTLHSFFLPLQIIVYTLLVFKFRNRTFLFLDNLSHIGLGIFLFHPIFVIWGQIFFFDVGISSFFKILIIASVALAGSVGLSRIFKPVYQKFINLL